MDTKINKMDHNKTSYEYEYRFSCPIRMISVAPSGFGKTNRLFKMFESADQMFDNPRQFDTIIYYYSTWSETFNEYKYMVTEWINKLPSVQDISIKLKEYDRNGSGITVVVDDFMGETSSDIQDIFTKYARNTNVSIILLWQDLFPAGRKNAVATICRIIKRQCTDLIVFKNILDKQQFINFARRFMPQRFRELTQLYNKVTNKPYSYLWIDCRTFTENKFRILSRVCPDEWPMKMYIFDIDDILYEEDDF